METFIPNSTGALLLSPFMIAEVNPIEELLVGC
jgi:hypothetical protein